MRTPRLPIVVIAWLLARPLDGAARPTAKPAPCTQPLWGCPTRATPHDSVGAAQRYERLMHPLRTSASTLRATNGDELDAAAGHLHEAVELTPDSAEAHSLLGQVELERGRLEPAGLALHRAEELAAASGPLERSDPQLALALGLLTALQGDLPGALDRYLRLLRVGAASHRLLYRTGDVLMALGRLDEATALYERACTLARGYDVPFLDLPRACQGYLVALDRGERGRAAQALRWVWQYDRELTVLKYNDFLTPWEREYHLALALPPSCDRLQALKNYLHGAKNPSTATTSALKSSPPLSYIRRAEVHVKELAKFICPSS